MSVHVHKKVPCPLCGYPSNFTVEVRLLPMSDATEKRSFGQIFLTDIDHICPPDGGLEETA